MTTDTTTLLTNGDIGTEAFDFSKGIREILDEEEMEIDLKSMNKRLRVVKNFIDNNQDFYRRRSKGLKTIILLDFADLKKSSFRSVLRNQKTERRED